MKFVILLTLMIFATYITVDAVNDAEEPLEASEDVNKIVGGSPTTIQQFPYIISLQSRNQHICGGSILNKNTILTAAHCISVSTRGYTIRAGSSNWATGGQTSAVSRVIIHPDYNRGVQFDNDIAILKLSPNLSLNSQVRATSVATARPANNVVCTVSGWGRLSENGSFPRQLYAVNVNVINQGRCRSIYGSGRVTDRMICAAARGRDACYGDSGGPLVAGGQQIGVVSWGSRCGGAPGVYASVSAFRSFINSNL